MRAGSVVEMVPVAGVVTTSRIAGLYLMPVMCVAGIMPPVPGVMGSYSVERWWIPVVSVMAVIRLKMAVVFATETIPLVSDVTVFTKVEYSMIPVVFVGVIIAPARAAMVFHTVAKSLTLVMCAVVITHPASGVMVF
jgi:hypothetical protein